MSVFSKGIAFFLFSAAVVAPAAISEPLYDTDTLPPAGIALFSASDFYGEVREAFDPVVTLHDLAFNDRTRSVAVLSGQWELCEHVNFTGRCVFVREDIADLSWFGLGGRITSIRPVYEYTLAQHGLMFTRDSYGRIRYAHNESYGYGSWKYGYSTNWRISISHYGHSPDYWRYGYYDPVWGYDPYGFAWSHHGRRLYPTTVVAVHPRPRVINRYWKKSRDRDWEPGYSPRDDRRRRRGDHDDRSYRGGPGEDGLNPPDETAYDGSFGGRRSPPGGSVGLPDRPRPDSPGFGRREGSDGGRVREDRRDRGSDGRGRTPPVPSAPIATLPDSGSWNGGGRGDRRDRVTGPGPDRGDSGRRPPPQELAGPPQTAVAPRPPPARARLDGDSARQADRGRRVPD